jgi:hypothetical protein
MSSKDKMPVWKIHFKIPHSISLSNVCVYFPNLDRKMLLIETLNSRQVVSNNIREMMNRHVFAVLSERNFFKSLTVLSFVF